jgi:hypothetical protein
MFVVKKTTIIIKVLELERNKQGGKNSNYKALGWQEKRTKLFSEQTSEEIRPS